jgi:uncharacterized protein
MKLRAFDCHTHFHTGDRARVKEQRNEDAERLFSTRPIEGNPLDYYRGQRMMAVVFDVDQETTTGLKINNDEVADLVAGSDGLLIGFASVDPWKGAAAIKEIERCQKRGLKGLKLQPITQQFFVNDRRFYPIWDACQSLGMPLLVHMGTTAIGANSPGGAGLHLKYGRPIPALDDLAADFPNLTIIGAHPGWPWHLELLAVARHKKNVYIDLSGWGPKYLPQEIIQHLNSVIPEKFLFGSDFPMMKPDRWLDDFATLPVKDSVRPKILFANACRLFGIAADRFALEGE